jgi:hypothetical protein
MMSRDMQLDYFSLARPRRVVPILDCALKRDLLALLTITVAAIGMGLISYTMLRGIR